MCLRTDFSAGAFAIRNNEVRKRGQFFHHPGNDLAGIYPAIESINLRREEARIWRGRGCVYPRRD